jgi:hypothetical protein
MAKEPATSNRCDQQSHNLDRPPDFSLLQKTFFGHIGHTGSARVKERITVA